MYQIDGLTENEIVNVINSIVNQLAPNYVVGYYTLEDIKQEGRMYGLEALPRFDPDKGEASKERNTIADRLYNFLRTHINCRYCNLIRNNYERAEPPNCNCNNCTNGNREDCKRYQKFLNRNTSKKLIAGPAQEPAFEQEITTPAADAESKELIELFNQHLPSHLRADFRRLLDNIKIPTTRKEKIKSILMDVMNSGVLHG